MQHLYGIILSSGKISNVIGPDEKDGITQENHLSGNADLNARIPSYTIHDAAALEFDFVPTSDILEFDYVFTSDEYNEYANTVYNDGFDFFVNGLM
jgi:hypothetical protein